MNKFNVTAASLMKMFPVSFDGYESDRYDNILSEENLISWIRGVMRDSGTSTEHSRYSYVISDRVPSNFGKSTIDQAPPFIEFLIGGYYVKLSDRWFNAEADVENDNKNYSVYARIAVTTGPFSTLENSGTFDTQAELKFVEFYKVRSGESLVLTETEFSSSDTYYLKILDVDITDSTEFQISIPEDSMFLVDGGEFK